MTRVILLKDVPKIGRKYEVKDVASGYATNYLFPNKLAEQATPAKEADLAKKRDAMNASKMKAAGEVHDLIKSLEGTTLTIRTKADDAGHLFKKLRADDIAGSKSGLLPEYILLKEPIKTAGPHEIHAAGAGAKATFTLLVEKE